MNDKTFNVVIDGRTYPAKPKQMLIEVMDANQIEVPRFCYHPRLSVAANCRMCMVEVEKIPKPVPACATPVSPDMQVRSRSKLALEGQKGTMEFLLINHPLDCPVCDQGGECELQDVSLAHGQSYSRFSEGKRVVRDENLGPLISTDMTRCIHCTRCVRFGTEVAGLPELGAVGRSEDMRISTFIEHSISSELSGNMIDVCPVGALNSKPYRMRARAWEMERHDHIANHDCLGSHTHVHVLRGKVLRVLPRECPSINQSWLSDRDRFSYTALEHPQRELEPSVYDPVKQRWGKIDWFTAIQTCVESITQAIQYKEMHKIGILAGANSSLEELHLLSQIARRLGIQNIDHRLNQLDFSQDKFSPPSPKMTCPVEALSTADAVLVIGGQVRKMQPIAGLRLRQAALAGAKISTINIFKDSVNYPVSEQFAGNPNEMFTHLFSIFKSLTQTDKLRSKVVAEAIAKWTQDVIVKPKQSHKNLANQLREGKSALLLLGAGAFSLPNFSAICALARGICSLTGAKLCFLPPYANSVGAWYSGCLPFAASGEDKATAGYNARQMFEEPLDTYIVYNCEPEYDSILAQKAEQALTEAKTVIRITPFVSEVSKEYANVYLPLATAYETSGTYVNAVGDLQYQDAAVSPDGHALPGWKILSNLAQKLGLDDLRYSNSADLSEEVYSRYENGVEEGEHGLEAQLDPTDFSSFSRLARPSVYHGDQIQRRSTPLRETVDGVCDEFAWIHPESAKKLGIKHGDRILITQASKKWQGIAQLTEDSIKDAVLTSLGSGADMALGIPYDKVSIEVIQ